MAGGASRPAAAARALRPGVALRPRRAGLLQVLRLLRREPPGAARSGRLAGGRRHASRRAADRHLVLHLHGDELRHRRVPTARSSRPPTCSTSPSSSPSSRPCSRARSCVPARCCRSWSRGGSSSRGQIREGVWLILWGLAKKMFMADNLAPIASAAFATGANPTGFEVLLAVYAYAFQIYGDFSGYSDVARGLAKLMGLELPVNFRFPYLVEERRRRSGNTGTSPCRPGSATTCSCRSASPSRAVWTGCRWLGFRDDVWIYAAATLVTMLLAGLWHGAAWSFVVWGLYQGVLLVAYRFASVARKQRRRRTRRGTPRASGRGPERSGDVPPDVSRMVDLPGRVGRTDWGRWWHGSSRASSHLLASWHQYGWSLLFYTMPLLIVHALEAWKDDLAIVLKQPAAVRYVRLRSARLSDSALRQLRRRPVHLFPVLSGRQ